VPRTAEVFERPSRRLARRRKGALVPARASSFGWPYTAHSAVQSLALTYGAFSGVYTALEHGLAGLVFPAAEGPVAVLVPAEALQYWPRAAVGPYEAFTHVVSSAAFTDALHPHSSFAYIKALSPLYPALAPAPRPPASSKAYESRAHLGPYSWSAAAAASRAYTEAAAPYGAFSYRKSPSPLAPLLTGGGAVRPRAELRAFTAAEKVYSSTALVKSVSPAAAAQIAVHRAAVRRVDYSVLGPAAQFERHVHAVPAKTAPDARFGVHAVFSFKNLSAAAHAREGVFARFSYTSSPSGAALLVLTPSRHQARAASGAAQAYGAEHASFSYVKSVKSYTYTSAVAGVYVSFSYTRSPSPLTPALTRSEGPKPAAVVYRAAALERPYTS
jgi:hypothetical protein